MDFLDYIYKRYKHIIEYPKALVKDVCDEFNMNIIAADFINNNKSIFVITPNLYLAQKYYDTLASLVNEEDVLFFPQDELVSAEMISSSGDFLYERINTLYTLLLNEKKIIVLNVVGAIKYEMPHDIWLKSFLKLEMDASYNLDLLQKQLISLGYEKTYTVTKTAEFARRGSIIDIFPFGRNNPIRLDFFDEELEAIKEFDVITQKSIGKLNEAFILPVSELLYDEDMFNIAKSKMLGFMDSYKLSELEEQMYKKDLDNLYLHKSLDTLSRYIKFFSPKEETIFDFVSNKKIYLIDSVKSKEMYERILLDIEDSCGRLGGYSLSSLKMFKPIDDIFKIADISLEGTRTMFDANISVNAKVIEPYKANQMQYYRIY